MPDHINADDAHHDQVLFKHDRIYKHNTMRINYTTYDVRRCQDIVNPFTSHCNLMISTEGDPASTSNVHPYRYAKVLGIYHANVVYVGPGMMDYQPRRMEFLWVRWYRQVTGDTCRLDRVHFLPVGDIDAFSFIDPLQILRSCHLVPAFAKGKTHADGKGLSVCAQDALDWRQCYVNR
jgi:hypothetical protein